MATELDNYVSYQDIKSLMMILNIMWCSCDCEVNQCNDDDDFSYEHSVKGGAEYFLSEDLRGDGWGVFKGGTLVMRALIKR